SKPTTRAADCAPLTNRTSASSVIPLCHAPRRRLALPASADRASTPPCISATASTSERECSPTTACPTSSSSATGCRAKSATETATVLLDRAPPALPPRPLSTQPVFPTLLNPTSGTLTPTATVLPTSS